MGPMPLTKSGNRYILVIGDYFTRWMEAYGLPSQHADVVAQKLVHEFISKFGGWSSGAMVLGKLSVPGRPTILITVGQGPIALAVGAGGGWFGHFYSHLFFLIFLPLFGRRPYID